MGRAKLSLVPIEKETYKNTTFQSRKAGLFKKAYEISTLCDVDACVIVYGPHTNVAETWPSDPAEVRRIIRRSATTRRGRHTLDLSDFFQSRKNKIERDIAKQRIKNTRAEYSSWDPRLDALSENQLRQFLSVLDTKLEHANRVKDMMTSSDTMMTSRFNDHGVGGCGNKLYRDNYFSDTDKDMMTSSYTMMTSSYTMMTSRFNDHDHGVGGYGNKLYRDNYFSDIDEGLRMKKIECTPQTDHISFDSSFNGNSLYYGFDQMGLYNGGFDRFGSSNGSNFESYTALLGGNKNKLSYYTMLGGDDVGSSSNVNGDEYSKSLVYYDVVSNQ